MQCAGLALDWRSPLGFSNGKDGRRFSWLFGLSCASLVHAHALEQAPRSMNILLEHVVRDATCCSIVHHGPCHRL